MRRGKTADRPRVKSKIRHNLWWILVIIALCAIFQPIIWPFLPIPSGWKNITLTTAAIVEGLCLLFIAIWAKLDHAPPLNQVHLEQVQQISVDEIRKSQMDETKLPLAKATQGDEEWVKIQTYLSPLFEKAGRQGQTFIFQNNKLSIIEPPFPCKHANHELTNTYSIDGLPQLATRLANCSTWLCYATGKNRVSYISIQGAGECVLLYDTENCRPYQSIDGTIPPNCWMLNKTGPPNNSTIFWLQMR